MGRLPGRAGTAPDAGAGGEAYSEWWDEMDVTRPPAMMPTYVLTWNPEKFAFSRIDELKSQIRSDGFADRRWGTGNRTNIVIGARAFLLRQGDEPRGLVGAGTVIEFPASTDRAETRTNVRWWHLDREPLVTRDELLAGKGSDFDWSPQASGTKLSLFEAALTWKAWDAAKARVTSDDSLKKNAADDPPPEPPAPSVADDGFDRVAYLERLTPGALAVLTAALSVAEETGSDSVEMKHLAVGFLHSGTGDLESVLSDLSISQTGFIEACSPSPALPITFKAVSMTELPGLSNQARQAVLLAERRAEWDGRGMDRRSNGPMEARSVVGRAVRWDTERGLGESRF